jgi:hypothetical protein
MAPSACAASMDAYSRGRFSPITTTWSPRFTPAGGHAAGQLSHQRGQRRPGQRLPDAVFLLAQRRRVGPHTMTFTRRAPRWLVWRRHGPQARALPVTTSRPLRKSVVAGLPVDTFHWLLDHSIGFNRFVMNQLNERLGQFIAAREIDG